MSSHSWQLSDFGLSNDPARPVLSALNQAFLENVHALLRTIEEAGDLAAQLSGKENEADVLRLMENVSMHAKHLQELMRWVFPPKVLPIDEAVSKAQVFKELGDDWVEKMASLMGKLPQGAPARKRQAHISAFEFMLQSRRNSLGLAVRKFCPCGRKDKHKRECARNFKAGIHVLTKMLRKYAPDLVTRYDALHPDRAKKANRK